MGRAEQSSVCAPVCARARAHATICGQTSQARKESTDHLRVPPTGRAVALRPNKIF